MRLIQVFASRFHGRLGQRISFAPDIGGDICLLPEAIEAVVELKEKSYHCFRLAVLSSHVVSNAEDLSTCFEQHASDGELLRRSVFIFGNRCESGCESKTFHATSVEEGSSGGQRDESPNGVDRDLDHWFVVKNVQCHRSSKGSKYSGEVWNMTGNGGAATALAHEGVDVWFEELLVTHVITLGVAGQGSAP